MGKTPGSRWTIPFASSFGFTALELLVAALIIILLATACVTVIARVEECAKITQAKVEIAQLAMAVEMVKQSTASYTLILKDLFSRNSPPGITKGWEGPYLKGGFYRDPWGTSYQICLPDKRSFVKEYYLPGGSDLFDWKGKGTRPQIRLDSGDETKIITSGTIILNGKTVAAGITSEELPKIYQIDYDLLESSNEIDVSFTGEPGASLIVAIPAVVPQGERYWLVSWAADRVEGGQGLGKDIVWHYEYADFQN